MEGLGRETRNRRFRLVHVHLALGHVAVARVVGAAVVEEAGRRVVHEPVEGVLALGGLVHVREDPLLEHLAVLDGVRPRIELAGAAEQRRQLRLRRLCGSHAG